MRSKEEVLARFEEQSERLLRERKAKYLSRGFMNCRWNNRLRIKGDGRVGFCSHPINFARTKGVFLCNEDCVAQKCRLFECRSTPEMVERDFKDVLCSPSRCGNEYPKLAVLIWFLQNDKKSGTRGRRMWDSAVELLVSARRIITFAWW
jgi:hypothetical protein